MNSTCQLFSMAPFSNDDNDPWGHEEDPFKKDHHVVTEPPTGNPLSLKSDSTLDAELLDVRRFAITISVPTVFQCKILKKIA